MSEYRLAIKPITNKVYTRIDFIDSTALPGDLRSFVSDGMELAVLDQSGSVVARTALDTEIGSITADPNAIRSVFGRVDIDGIRAEAYRLRLDVQEDTASGLFAISLRPDGETAAFGSARVLSQRLFYDTEAEVFAGAEACCVEDDGTELSLRYTPIYQEAEGEPVKVADVTELDYGEETEAAAVEADDGIETVTETELAALRESGAEVEEIAEPLSVGDRNMMVIDVYDQIEINTVDDALFRPFAK